MKARFVLCFMLTVFSSLPAKSLQMKPHEHWWERNLSFKMHDFEMWLGDKTSPSRKMARDYVLKNKYQSILDIPCGLGTDYLGYQEVGASLTYLGVDITKELVDRACNLGINAIQGSIEDIPLPDTFVDISYARHILEHLDYYEKALDELIRVAKKEVLVVFFMRPIEEPDKLDLQTVDGQLLYHNYYNRLKIETYVKKNPKVNYFKWEDVDSNELILHILLHQK